ncbi:MAG: hypothetical protein AB1916_11725 [Thermodesulfobacteriota bacterium]
MRKLVTVLLCAVLLLGAALGPSPAQAQDPKPVCAYCNTPLPGGAHSSNCPYYTAPKSSGGGKASHYGGGMDMQSMIVGSIFGALLQAAFAPPYSAQDDAEARKQQEAAALEAQKKAAELAAKKSAEMRAKEAAAQAEFEKMMQSYKQLDGAARNPKGGLGLKGLDGDMEAMAAGARKPFDTGGLGLKGLDDAPPAPAPTPFFGDAMPVADIQLLVNPDSDPRVVDLRDAKKFVAENLKKEAQEKKPSPMRDAPASKSPDCERLSAKLAGFLEQRQKFHKTVLLAQEQLDTWREANRNALLNAAKDGFEHFAGQYLEALSKRGRAAERYKGVLERRAEEMAREGIDVAAIRAKIDRMARLSTAGQVAELTNKLNDWTTFAKDGLSAMLVQLAASDAEVKAVLEDPKVGKYFETDAPALNALFDLSKIMADAGVFGKWVAKKVPLIAGIEITAKQSYNGLDWLLSFNRIMDAHSVNGKVLDAAKGLQQHIDDTYYELKSCR